jgi:hypothetical protein
MREARMRHAKRETKVTITEKQSPPWWNITATLPDGREVMIDLNPGWNTIQEFAEILLSDDVRRFLEHKAYRP